MDNKISNESYIFYCSQQDFPRIEQPAMCELPLLDSVEAYEYTVFQEKLLIDLRAENAANLIFMSSPLACANSWQSDFFVGLESLFRLKKLMREKSTIYLVCVDAAWRDVILTQAKMFQTQILFNSHTLRRKSQTYLSLQAFKYMSILAQPFNKKLKVKIDNLDLIFFTTWFEKTIENYGVDQTDPYFGAVPVAALKSGLKVGTFCHVENFKPNNIPGIVKLAAYNIFSYFSFLNILDVSTIYLQIAFSYLCVPQEYKYLAKVIKEDVQNKKWFFSTHALMIERVLHKLKRNSPQLRVIHTYEGNCWEKGCAMGADKVIGYQHTGFSPSFQKMKNSRYWMPQVILTSGKKIKDILAKDFKHDSSKIIPSIALRQSRLLTYSPKKELPSTYKRILLLLQGSPFDVRFLKSALEFVGNYSAEIYVRQHPAFVLPNLNLDSKFLVSTNINLYDDILQSDLVLYNGTTAAMEAAYLGVPCVYIDYGTTLSNDPFISLPANALIYDSINYTNLDQVIATLQKNRDMFTSSLKQIQEYFALYFEQKSPLREQEFLNHIMSF